MAAEANTKDLPQISVSDFSTARHAECQDENKNSSNAGCSTRRSYLYPFSQKVIAVIERACGAWGWVVATYPWQAIVFSLIIVMLSGCGLYSLQLELRPYKLWVKEPSEFKVVHEWRMKNFPTHIRKHIALWEMPNVLTGDSIREMWELHKKTSTFETPSKKVRYEDVCVKVPSLLSAEPEYDYSYSEYDSYDPADSLLMPDWLSYGEKDKDASFSKDYDSIIPPNDNADLPAWLQMNDTKSDSQPKNHYISSKESAKIVRSDHCAFVRQLNLICYEESLLEVWGYNEKVISSLTDEQVIADINKSKASRVTGFPSNISAFLGDIERDTHGKIISAKGALQVWYTNVDMKEIKRCKETGCKIEIDLGSGEQVDELGMEWEIHLSTVVDEIKARGRPLNLQASYLFGSIHRAALFKDFRWICLGWSVLTLYIVVTIGKPLSQDSRIIPALAGIFCVAFSVLSSYGICTVFKIPYGPLNSVLPVLLVALGVDDMYVILNAWDSIRQSNEAMVVKAVTVKCLQRAGRAITVTTLTNVIAFIVGATTEVPALKYFCVYAAVGIILVYLLQITMFVAAVVLNQRRQDSRGRSCIPVIRCNGKRMQCTLMNNLMKLWSKFLLRPAAIAFFLIFSGCVLGGAFCQVLKLRQSFESVWLLPKSSDLYRFFKTMDVLFPKNGRQGYVYFEGVDVVKDLPKLQHLSQELKGVSYVSRVDAWYDQLVTFIQTEKLYKNENLTESVFKDALSYFLFSEQGAKYRNDIVFANDTELNCTNPTPDISVFKINFRYFRIEDNKEKKQAAMSSVRNLVSNSNITGFKAPWALSYGQWETDEVITRELLTNLIIVLSIVFLVTMILLGSFRAAVLVLISVLATLLSVAALMDLWGLSINTVTCIALVLAIGICGDYAHHITHGFLDAQGNRSYRTQSALRHMGPAVLHGGISTLIAFILLAPSDTFVFISYFKILTGVAVCGLYNALVLLPILLYLVGPPSYPGKANEPHEDSQSCTTESTQFPYTPNSLTPVQTPQSTTPNSPNVSRSGSDVNTDPNTSASSSTAYSHPVITTSHRGQAPQPPNKHVSCQTINASSVLGTQAMQNMTLVEASGKDTKSGEIFVKPARTLSARELAVARAESVRTKHRLDNTLKIYVRNP